MNYGGLILAAGASTRLGSPKQLARLGNETLLDRSIRIAHEAGCVAVVVVLGAFEDMIRRQCRLHDVLIVSNPDWPEGMGTSLARGVRAFEKVEGILVMTCDMPAVTPEHLRILAKSGGLTASSYANRNGVPAYFPCALFPKLASLKGDIGARELLRSAHVVELLGGELDVDTWDDLVQSQELFV